MSGRTIRYLAAGCALAAAALPTGCATSEGKTATERPAVAVEAAEAASERVSVTVRAVGSLEAREEVEVRAEAEGRVHRVHFREGTEVRRGSPLLTLDDEELAARVAEMEARVRLAEVVAEEERDALERRRPLLERQLVSVDEFRRQEKVAEAALAELEATRASLRLIRRQLKDTRIVAPVTGRTGVRQVSEGDFIEKSDLVVRIFDTASLEVAFRIPERHLADLREGQEVELRVSAFPGDSFPGRITFLAPSLDVVSRTVALKAEVPNEGGLLRPGLFAQVDVVLGVREDAVVIPEEAVVPREDGDWVFVVEESTARRRRVRIGERMPGRVEVLNGLVSGETVVTAGQQKLADGAGVRIIEAAPDRPENGASAGEV